jgi:pimeloyl-ACP methyl ester carboxylesterase
MNGRGPAGGVIVALLFAAACGGPTTTPKTTGSVAKASGDSSDGKTRVRGSVSLDPPLAGYAPRGQLAVGWLTPEEAHAFEEGRAPSMRTVKELATERLVAVGEADFLTLATRVPYALELPEPPKSEDVVPFAVVDTCGNVYGALFGGCDGAVLGFGAVTHVKPAATVTTGIVLTRRRQPEGHVDGCPDDHGRRELLRVTAPGTAGLVNNDPSRRACVWLPESYARHTTRRYPVIYVLPGLGGDDAAFYHRKVDLDEVEKAAGREAILVSVDTSTRHGSTYLTKSPLEGDFDTFLAMELPAAVDKAYRTLAPVPLAGRGKGPVPRFRGRALIGQSTGGFTAMAFALRHSDLFSAVASMSPDGLDLGDWLAPDGKGFAAPWLHMLRLEDAMNSQGEMASLGASFSPDPKSPRGFDWPCDPATGKLDDAVWARWLQESPSTMIESPAILEAARANLSGRIYVTVAEHDEFELFEPAKRFTGELARAGVEAAFVPTGGGHTEGVEARERAALEALLKSLDPAKP